MQTRRKSLNLGDLGVVAPKRSRTTISHPSPPETVYEGEERPSKKSKQSHRALSPSRSLMSPPRTTVIRIRVHEQKPKRATELSPPPSPVAAESSSKIDFEGINDDIVIGTLQQIEKTGNRPHLVKELAAVLATKLHGVEKSANPSALISSRLTAYLNRTWPPVSPCPLAKDLSPVHPRRLYFYLTTTPHQPIPESVTEPIRKANRIISPSLSSASAADEENEYRRRREVLSPSPEVDLSSPELDEDHGDPPPTPGRSFSARNSISRDRSASYTHPRRNASPPLETEEQDFKQTASALYEEAQKRRNSQQSQQDVNMDADAVGGADEDGDSVTMSIEPEETEESAALKNSEAAAALFGPSDHLQVTSAQQMEFSSPILQPQKADVQDDADHMTLSFGKDDLHISLPEAALGWDSLQSPEDIEVGDLDDMFDAY